MKKIWLWALVAFNVIDVLTTLIAITHLGGTELNPLVNFLLGVHPAIWVIWKALGIGWISHSIEDYPELWNSTLIKLAVLFYAVVAGLQILTIFGF